MATISRRGFIGQGLAASGVYLANRQASADSPNEQIGIGVIGVGGRGSGLARGFAGQKGARLVAVADPDESRAGKFAKDDCKAYTDLRQLLDDKNVDAVVIATCNHWHCLAAIWAMQAGKDVYVEKPLSHNQWEGRKVVEAARKYNRMVQLGTQQRSDPMQADIKRFLHEEQALGKILYAQANRLGPRGQIGKRDTPLEIPKSVNYDLWLGPAQDEPIYRTSLHYDWHWDFNTGSGEMGNWGVHVLDDVRNVVYQDQVSTPRRIVSVGGRFAWNDAGNTPNVHYVYFDTGSYPTLIALSNLPADAKGGKGGWSTKCDRAVSGPGTGYVVACEGGYYLGGRGSGKAVDKEGKTIRQFKGGSMDSIHRSTFLDAIRTRDRSLLMAEIETGHHSSGWCNLANVGHRVAGTYHPEQATAASDLPAWGLLLEEMEKQLAKFDVAADSPEIRMSQVLQHDPQTERFVGDNASLANEYLRRKYRAPYEVPETV